MRAPADRCTEPVVTTAAWNVAGPEKRDVPDDVNRDVDVMSGLLTESKSADGPEMGPANVCAVGLSFHRNLMRNCGSVRFILRVVFT